MSVGTVSLDTWNNGYNGIACGEYHLRNGDASVLPIMQHYCDDAKARQKFGCGWTHWSNDINPGPSTARPDGPLHRGPQDVGLVVARKRKSPVVLTNFEILNSELIRQGAARGSILNHAFSPPAFYHRGDVS